MATTTLARIPTVPVISPLAVGMVAEEEETAAETGEAYKAVFAPVRNDP